jgi:hypothetical protein
VRVLDLDLDFFIHGVAHYRESSDDRLEPEYATPWDLDAAITFVEQQCAVDRKLPGMVVEHHGELFPLWRRALETSHLVAPFHVTHVDAHADLGLGDAGYKQIMTQLLFLDPEERANPVIGGPYGLGDGNYLAFALACRWISDLVYVHNDEGGDDLMTYHLENCDPLATNIELKAVRPEDFDRKLFFPAEPLVPDRTEPKIPFLVTNWRSFRAEAPYDFICLAHSPGFTPVGSDLIFDELRARFIDELFPMT